MTQKKFAAIFIFIIVACMVLTTLSDIVVSYSIGRQIGAIEYILFPIFISIGIILYFTIEILLTFRLATRMRNDDIIEAERKWVEERIEVEIRPLHEYFFEVWK